MRSSLFPATVFFCIFSASILAQTDELIDRDVPEEIELLLNSVSNMQQREIPTEIFEQLLTSLAEHYENELNVLLEPTEESRFEVSYFDQEAERVARIFSVALTDRLIHIVRYQNSLQIYEADVSRDRLARAIRYYLRELQISSSFNGMERGSAELFNWVVQPYIGDLREAGVETLAFTPSASLRNLPLSTLMEGRQFLIDDFDISVSLGVVGRINQAENFGNSIAENNYSVEALGSDVVLTKSQQLANRSFPMLQFQSVHLLTDANVNLVSLWPTESSVSEQLIESFTAALGSGADYSSALRAAQRQVKSSGRFGHAYYWGSYLLVE